MVNLKLYLLSINDFKTIKVYIFIYINKMIIYN